VSDHLTGTDAHHTRQIMLVSEHRARVSAHIRTHHGEVTCSLEAPKCSVAEGPGAGLWFFTNKHFQTPIYISMWMKEIANYCHIYIFKNMPITLGAVLLILPLANNYRFQLINKH